MLHKNCNGKIVYYRAHVAGNYIGVHRYRIDGYLSIYKVVATDIDRNYTTCMSIFDLYESYAEAEPPKCLSSDEVASKLVKHVKVIFNQAKGGLYGR